MKHVLQVIDLLDNSKISDEKIKEMLNEFGVENVKITHLSGSRGKTCFIKILIPGKNGKEQNGTAPTLGIIGRLGGVGARPEVIGMVSDADGAIVALACAIKLGESRKRGDILEGDVIITTHITPNAPIRPHKPVSFMDSPIDMTEMLKHEVDPKMDAILSVDATKGNRVIKVHGFAITPTVKDGWILKVSDDLINIYERVTGDIVAVVPITMQDITPYTNNVYHINSIMQPWLMTNAPVVGVATTARVPIPGCGTGANYILGLEQATRFCIEIAKEFTNGKCKFYDEKEFKILTKLYGNLGRIFRKNLK
jgi:hypothetical protein